MRSRGIPCVMIVAMMGGCATPPEVTISRPGGAAAVNSSARASAGGQSEPIAVVEPTPGMAGIQIAKQKTAADPLNWRSFNELGLAYNKAKLYDEAIASFEQALTLHPITTTLEGEKKQQESIDAQHDAVLESQKRQQKYQQDAQNAAAMSSVFSTVLGTLPNLPGGNAQSMIMLPTIDALQQAASLPAIPGVVDMPKTTLESQLKPKREVAAIYFNLGIAHFGKGNYGQSVHSLDNSLTTDPSRVEVLWWEAEASFRQGNFLKSIAMMNRFLALGSTRPSPTCFTRLSESFRALGLDKDARKAFFAGVEEYKRRIAAAPEDVDTARELAFAYISQDLYSEAEKLILELLEKNNSGELLLDLASTQLLQSRYADALQNVQKVLTGTVTCKDPSRAWYLAGRVYDELESAEEAQKAYRKAAELIDSLPTDKAVPSHAPVVLAAVGRYDEARKEIETKLSRDPFGADASLDLFRLGIVCEKGGHDVEAMAALNRALLLRPRFTHVTSVLNRLAKKHSALREKALVAAEVSIGQKDSGAAIRHLSTAFQLMAASPQKQQLLQRILTLAGEMDNPPPLTMEAQRYYLRGNAALKSAKEPADLDRAISEFQWAAAYAPWVAPIYLSSSVAYGVRLRYAKAMDALKLFIIGSPRAKNVEDALTKLAELEYQQEETLRSVTFKGYER